MLAGIRQHQPPPQLHQTNTRLGRMPPEVPHKNTVGSIIGASSQTPETGIRDAPHREIPQ